jgi:capsular polysaccharide biosynthesis protein
VPARSIGREDRTVAAERPASVSWSFETFPIEPTPSDDAVLEIAGAILTPYRSGPLRTLQAPYRWTRGAVYDAGGNLIAASQRIGGLGGDHVVAADPTRIPPPARRRWSLRARTGGPRRLPGAWVYAGTWMNHFGHFITETLTTLWPSDLEVTGLVAHPFIFGGDESEWQRDLLELAGYGSLPRVLAQDGLRVDRLLVPTRSFVTNGYATPNASGTWQRVADAATVTLAPPRPGSVLFISRRRWHERAEELGRPAPRRLEDEASLDRYMESRGYRVIYPEEMAIRLQISAVRSVETLVGVSGSALHLSAFARQGTRVIEICDPRSGTGRLPNQRVVDAACGHRTASIPFTGDTQEVLSLLEAFLGAAGI